MRSKKIRIVVTGSLLSVLAVVLAIRKESAAPPRPLDLKSVQVPAAPLGNSREFASVEETEFSTPETSATAPALWRYTHKPANAARVESIMMTPSHDIHYAQIDHALLSSDRSPLRQEGGRFDVTLPDGSVLPVVVAKTETLGPDRYVSEGSVNGQNESRAVFAYHEGEMSAVIDDAEHGSWQIRSVGGSTAQVFKVDSTMVPSCNESAHHPAAGSVATVTQGEADADVHTDADIAALVQGEAPVAGGNVLSATAGVQAPRVATTSAGVTTQIRILVPYSKVIETVMSPSAIRSSIDLAIAQLNNDLTRSAVPVRVTLAGAPAIQYNQEWTATGGPVLTALKAITSTVDGIMDQVHVMRVDAKADLVCFAMCRHDSSYSGAGYILNVAGDVFNALNGFSVVDFWYMSSSSTFSHEIGHNLGCSHDREHSASMDGSVAGGIYRYSHGYRFYGKDGKQYRTIMAYPPGNVLPYFSNPNLVAWSPISVAVGAPLGRSNEAYNALTITQNAAEVAAYRTSRLTERVARRIRGY